MNPDSNDSMARILLAMCWGHKYLNMAVDNQIGGTS